MSLESVLLAVIAAGLVVAIVLLSLLVARRPADARETRERFEALHALHPKPLDNARDKLFWFLCGWLGGPDLYIERFGHPRLRARHLPYPIASRERDQWLLCMAEAMADLEVPQPLFDRLLEAFSGTADWMRNRAG